MKFLVVLCAVAACCVAKPGGYLYTALAPLNNIVVSSVAYAASPIVVAPAAPVAAAVPAPAVLTAPVVKTVVVAPDVKTVAAVPVVAAAAPVVAGVKTQYHAQDELGQAAYGHSEPGQVHNAVQDAHGNKVGSFSYVNPEGHVLRTDYVADGAGYRVASNALPAAPVVQTPVVAVAGKVRARRSVLVQTPAATVPLATTVVASPVVAPVAKVIAPIPAPVAYTAPAASHLAYAAPALKSVAPVATRVSYAVSAPAVLAAVPSVRAATLTTIVNNPGHAVTYRVD